MKTTCTICKKEHDFTYPAKIYFAKQNLGTTNMGYSGGQRVTQTRYADFGSCFAQICPHCIMKKLKSKLITGAVIAAVIAGAMIYCESGGIGDTLIMVAVYIAFSLILFGVYRWEIADVIKERRFRLGEISKRGRPLTSGYQAMAEQAMVHYAARTNYISDAVAYFSEAAFNNLKPN